MFASSPAHTPTPTHTHTWYNNTDMATTAPRKGRGNLKPTGNTTFFLLHTQIEHTSLKGKKVILQFLNYLPWHTHSNKPQLWSEKKYKKMLKKHILIALLSLFKQCFDVQ